MQKSMTYKKAGVDIAKTDALVKRIKTLCQSTRRREVLGTIGSFSGFFGLPRRTMRNPVLVASTDGVGTKIKVAQLRDDYTSVGIDLVAMCVNDIITTGAEPLFFLDYFAAGKIMPDQLYRILKGVVTGCKQAHCALIGGEMAEMPDVYTNDNYDMAGFCVGIVERDKIINEHNVKVGDVILGLAATGLHSNGYSLARKLFNKREIKQSQWGKILLRPTRIYVRPILSVINSVRVKAMAHITGGGLYENIPRVIPKETNAILKKRNWHVPSIFKEINKRGNISEREMHTTFNMGIGMVIIIDPKDVGKATAVFKRYKVKTFRIGTIEKGSNNVVIQ